MKFLQKLLWAGAALIAAPAFAVDSMGAADWRGTAEEEKATPNWMIQPAQLPVDTNEVVVADVPQGMTLFLLVGQSNMAGRGRLIAEDRKAIPRCLKLNRGGKWVAATSPLHFDRKTAGYGIANTFVKRYLEEHPGETVGLVPCAVGGSLSVTWSPEPRAAGKIGANYRYTLGRARTALKNGTFAGILWHQGESDAGLLKKDPSHKRRYVARLAALAQALRTELKCPEVPFLVGEIGTLPCDCTAMNPILREAAACIPRGALVQARDLTGHLADGVHFDTPSYKVLGARYYDAWKVLAERDVRTLDAVK